MSDIQSSRTQKALRLIMDEGISAKEAAERVGITQAAVSKGKLHLSKTQQRIRMLAEMQEEIESLRQQLAEKDAEIERLKKQAIEVRHELNLADRLAKATVQLATSQARERQLREALTGCVCAMQDYQAGISITEMFDKNERLGRLALQSEKQDNAALSAMIAKAGEVMRERCRISAWATDENLRQKTIRALPPITLDDLK